MLTTYLDKEHSLNKVLKNQKAENSNINILFVSLWDSFSTKLLEKIEDLPKDNRSPELFIVDSFHMPHSFVIFKTTKLPHLVSINNKQTQSEDYLPNIYKKLNIK
jgi:hypothetical protein